MSPITNVEWCCHLFQRAFLLLSKIVLGKRVHSVQYNRRVCRSLHLLDIQISFDRRSRISGWRTISPFVKLNGASTVITISPTCLSASLLKLMPGSHAGRYFTVLQLEYFKGIVNVGRLRTERKYVDESWARQQYRRRPLCNSFHMGDEIVVRVGNIISIRKSHNNACGRAVTQIIDDQKHCKLDLQTDCFRSFQRLWVCRSFLNNLWTLRICIGL